MAAFPSDPRWPLGSCLRQRSSQCGVKQQDRGPSERHRAPPSAGCDISTAGGKRQVFPSAMSSPASISLRKFPARRQGMKAATVARNGPRFSNVTQAGGLERLTGSHGARSDRTDANLQRVELLPEPAGKPCPRPASPGRGQPLVVGSTAIKIDLRRYTMGTRGLNATGVSQPKPTQEAFVSKGIQRCPTLTS
jgi:hypothetical protein